MRTLVLSWLVIAVGCGDSPDVQAPDAGVDAPSDADVGPRAPTPALPVLTPCPTGWRELRPADATEPTTCEPWPGGSRLPCAEHEVHIPGEPGCTVVGSTCPRGDFGDDLPADRVLYVHAGKTGGDGTRAAPFGTIAEATPVATTGTTIALSHGRYAENVRLGEGVVLAGACAAATLVTSTSTTDPAIVVEGADVEVRNLGILDALSVGLRVRTGQSARLEGVIIDGAHRRGIGVELGGGLDSSDVVVRNTRAIGLGGQGIVLSGGSMADLSRTVVADNAISGVAIGSAGGSATTVRIADSAIHGHDGGLAISVSSVAGDASTVVARSVLEASDGGLLVRNGTATFEDSVVRDMADAGRPRGLVGLLSVDASVSARRITIDRAQGAGLFVFGADAVVDVEDAVVRDTRTFAGFDGMYGRGMDVEEGGAARLSRVYLGEHRDLGAYVAGAGSAADLTDTWIVDTAPDACDGTATCDAGMGLGAYMGAAITLDTFAIDAALLCGIHVADGGAADVSSGVVSRCAIGACIQIDGYDVGRLQDRVEYRDNETNLQTTTLPVPEPFVPLGG